MLLEISNLVRMIVFQEGLAAHMLKAESRMMQKAGGGLISNAAAVIPDSATKIHVFKPGWGESFVEAADYLQSRSGNHQTCGGGLIDFDRICAVAGLMGSPADPANLIDKKGLSGHSPDSGERPEIIAPSTG